MSKHMSIVAQQLEKERFAQNKRKRENLELLSIKKPTTLDDIRSRVPTPKSPLPSNALPGWKERSLDSKLPAVPAPHGTFALSQGDLGNNIFVTVPNQVFDIRDPLIKETPINYHSLLDSNLKDYFQANPAVCKRLLELGLVNNEGQVISNLADFNKYRKYLGRIQSSEVTKEQERLDNWERNDFETVRNLVRHLENSVKHELEEQRRERMATKRAEIEEENRQKRLRELEHPSNYIQEKRSIEAKLRKAKRDALRKNVSDRLKDLRDAEKRKSRHLVLEWICKDEFREKLRNVIKLEKEINRQDDLNDFIESKRSFQEQKNRYQKALRQREKIENDCKVQARSDTLEKQRDERAKNEIEKKIKAQERVKRISFLMDKYGYRWLFLTRKYGKNSLHTSTWHVRNILHAMVQYVKQESGAKNFQDYLRDILKSKKTVTIKPETRAAVNSVLEVLVRRSYEEFIKRATTCLVDYVVDETRKTVHSSICAPDFDSSALQAPVVPKRHRDKITLPRPTFPCTGPCAEFGVGRPEWPCNCVQELEWLHGQLCVRLMDKLTEGMTRAVAKCGGIDNLVSNAGKANRSKLVRKSIDGAKKVVLRRARDKKKVGILDDKAATEPRGTRPTKREDARMNAISNNMANSILGSDDSPQGQGPERIQTRRLKPPPQNKEPVEGMAEAGVRGRPSGKSSNASDSEESGAQWTKVAPDGTERPKKKPGNAIFGAEDQDQDETPTSRPTPGEQANQAKAGGGKPGPDGSDPNSAMLDPLLRDGGKPPVDSETMETSTSQESAPQKAAQDKKPEAKPDQGAAGSGQAGTGKEPKTSSGGLPEGRQPGSATSVRGSGSIKGFGDKKMPGQGQQGQESESGASSAPGSKSKEPTKGKDEKGGPETGKDGQTQADPVTKETKPTGTETGTKPQESQATAAAPAAQSKGTQPPKDDKGITPADNASKNQTGASSATDPTQAGKEAKAGPDKPGEKEAQTTPPPAQTTKGTQPQKGTTSSGSQPDQTTQNESGTSPTSTDPAATQTAPQKNAEAGSGTQKPTNENVDTSTPPGREQGEQTKDPLTTSDGTDPKQAPQTDKDTSMPPSAKGKDDGQQAKPPAAEKETDTPKTTKEDAETSTPSPTAGTEKGNQAKDPSKQQGTDPSKPPQKDAESSGAPPGKEQGAQAQQAVSTTGTGTGSDKPPKDTTTSTPPPGGEEKGEQTPGPLSKGTEPDRQPSSDKETQGAKDSPSKGTEPDQPSSSDKETQGAKDSPSKGTEPDRPSSSDKETQGAKDSPSKGTEPDRPLSKDKETQEAKQSPSTEVGNQATPSKTNVETGTGKDEPGKSRSDGTLTDPESKSTGTDSKPKEDTPGGDRATQASPGKQDTGTAPGTGLGTSSEETQSDPGSKSTGTDSKPKEETPGGDRATQASPGQKETGTGAGPETLSDGTQSDPKAKQGDAETTTGSREPDKSQETSTGDGAKESGTETDTPKSVETRSGATGTDPQTDSRGTETDPKKGTTVDTETPARPDPQLIDSGDQAKRPSSTEGTDPRDKPEQGVADTMTRDPTTVGTDPKDKPEQGVAETMTRDPTTEGTDPKDKPEQGVAETMTRDPTNEGTDPKDRPEQGVADTMTRDLTSTDGTSMDERVTETGSGTDRPEQGVAETGTRRPDDGGSQTDEVSWGESVTGRDAPCSVGVGKDPCICQPICPPDPWDNLAISEGELTRVASTKVNDILNSMQQNLIEKCREGDSGNMDSNSSSAKSGPKGVSSDDDISMLVDSLLVEVAGEGACQPGSSESALLQQKCAALTGSDKAKCLQEFGKQLERNRQGMSGTDRAQCLEEVANLLAGYAFTDDDQCSSMTGQAQLACMKEQVRRLPEQSDEQEKSSGQSNRLNPQVGDRQESDSELSRSASGLVNSILSEQKDKLHHELCVVGSGDERALAGVLSHDNVSRVSSAIANQWTCSEAIARSIRDVENISASCAVQSSVRDKLNHIRKILDEVKSDLAEVGIRPSFIPAQRQPPQPLEAEAGASAGRRKPSVRLLEPPDAEPK